MTRISTLFLQILVAMTGLLALAFLILAPLAEGRAANLDLFSIYTDPFILFMYAASIAFFVGLYNGFNLLGFIRKNKTYSQDTVGKLKKIKYCAIIFGLFIAGAGICIKIAHDKEDDPAGFLALCIIIVFGCTLVACAATLFEKRLQKGRDL